MDKKKIMIIVGIVLYVIFAVIVIINLPNIISLGDANIKTILTNGQTAAIYDRSIDISSYSGELKNGQTIYISTEGNSPKIYETKQEGTTRALVTSINGNIADIKVYVTNGQSDTKAATPGVTAFQFLIAGVFVVLGVVGFKKFLS